MGFHHGNACPSYMLHFTDSASVFSLHSGFWAKLDDRTGEVEEFRLEQCQSQLANQQPDMGGD